MPTVITDNFRMDEFVRISDPPEYTTESKYIENTSGAIVVMEGKPYPVKAGSDDNHVEIMTAAETQTPANILGFIVSSQKQDLPATTGVSRLKYPILTNGPAVVSRNRYADADPLGAAYAAAVLDTFCAAASPFIRVSDEQGALISTPFVNP